MFLIKFNNFWTPPNPAPEVSSPGAGVTKALAQFPGLNYVMNFRLRTLGACPYISLLEIAPDFETDLVAKIEQNRRRSWATASRSVENLDVPPPKISTLREAWRSHRLRTSPKAIRGLLLVFLCASSQKIGRELEACNMGRNVQREPESSEGSSVSLW